MEFTREDFAKLTRISELLVQTVNLLNLKFPSEDEPARLHFRLDVFRTGMFEELAELYLAEQIAEDDIVDVFPPDLAAMGNDCFRELDLISDDIYSYIDRKGVGRDMRILQNEDFF